MAKSSSISNAAAIDACDAIVDLVDSGGAGTLVIYDGTVPTNADTSLSGNNVLITFTLPNPSFGAAADAIPNATATMNAVSSVNASATGTASFFRILNNGGTCVIQGNCATSDADLVMSTTSVVSGTTVTFTSYTFTIPEVQAG